MENPFAKKYDVDTLPDNGIGEPKKGGPWKDVSPAVITQDVSSLDTPTAAGEPTSDVEAAADDDVDSEPPVSVYGYVDPQSERAKSVGPAVLGSASRGDLFIPPRQAPSDSQ